MFAIIDFIIPIRQACYRGKITTLPFSVLCIIPQLYSVLTSDILIVLYDPDISKNINTSPICYFMSFHLLYQDLDTNMLRDAKYNLEGSLLRTLDNITLHTRVAFHHHHNQKSYLWSPSQQTQCIIDPQNLFDL